MRHTATALPPVSICLELSEAQGHSATCWNCANLHFNLKIMFEAGRHKWVSFHWSLKQEFSFNIIINFRLSSINYSNLASYNSQIILRSCP